jgi:hypothetical protein
LRRTNSRPGKRGDDIKNDILNQPGIFQGLGFKYARKLSRWLNNLLPWRPHQPKHTHLSWGVRVKGRARNIKLHPGCRVSEDVMLHIHDDRSCIEIGRGTLVMPFAKLVAADAGSICIGANCTIHSFDVLYGL